MRVRFEVTPDKGDPYKVVADGRDFLTWERGAPDEEDRSITGFARARRAVDIYELAHAAAARQGLFKGTLREFEAAHDVDLTDLEDKEADPTRSAAKAD